jgi:uncharacterized protein (TIGR02145 family)
LTVTATVHAVPVITRSGGDASQTVNQFTAITPVTYTASNATGIALSSGSFPTGVNGTPNGVVFTVSGTPTVSGTFNYAVTATHTNGCTSAASTGVLTVNAVATTPPNAASTRTWTYGTQTWSDRIIAAPSNCTNTNTLTTSNYTTAEYKVSDGRYYYSWTCAYNNRTAFCPDPWRLPTQSDFDTLDSNITSPTTLVSDWGYGGGAQGSSMLNVSTAAYYWSSTEFSSGGDSAYYLLYYSSDLRVFGTNKYDGLQVRCVKD